VNKPLANLGLEVDTRSCVCAEAHTQKTRATPAQGISNIHSGRLWDKFLHALYLQQPRGPILQPRPPAPFHSIRAAAVHEPGSRHRPRSPRSPGAGARPLCHRPFCHPRVPGGAPLPDAQAARRGRPGPARPPRRTCADDALGVFGTALQEKIGVFCSSVRVWETALVCGRTCRAGCRSARRAWPV
jgi:hypothetical protein